MSKIKAATTTALLADRRGIVEWLRLNPTGVLARSQRKKVREIDEELAERGVDVEAAALEERGPIRGFVVFFHNRPGQPRTGSVIHFDQHCDSIKNIPSEDIREATSEELAKLRPCAWCGQ
jgi:hypothetical protein